MGYEITKEFLETLHELADLQHPHLAGDNHTRFIVDKVYNGEKLTPREAFDCGKYYQRMLAQLKDVDDSDGKYLRAILALKWSV